ncbi:hydrolase [Actinophytocola xinjiangensis]|uniref:Hydrolase n=1 Tax=Actinophytocola xinjiangensis TaxID=485602 RepID=A0A7Z0WQ14_9PSEU|nr:alpha/beta family hydrolase [Actinophytocola xinjiangensis]OLF10218.1 hydrolase [Actinophytocola xinjiangensis]
MFVDEDLLIPLGDARLAAGLTLPHRTGAVVAFAHGSGSSRHSPRNRYVAAVLHAAGLGTVLLDLLTAEEEAHDLRTGELRFEIPLLAARLTAALDWLADRRDTTGRPVGLFGASTGAAAALVTASVRPGAVRAVVSRGGRPDLAGDALDRVRAPTLLVVGGRDEQVVELNTNAQRRLPPGTTLEIVPGATHLFEEPGTLERVAELARDWFVRHTA